MLHHYSLSSMVSCSQKNQLFIKLTWQVFVLIEYCKPTFICTCNFNLRFTSVTDSWWLMFTTKPYPDSFCYKHDTTRSGLQREKFMTTRLSQTLKKIWIKGDLITVIVHKMIYSLNYKTQQILHCQWISIKPQYMWLHVHFCIYLVCHIIFLLLNH